MPQPTLLTAVALVLVAGPVLLACAGILRERRTGHARGEPGAPWDWRLSVASALLFAIAFNLTFFIQELFLVLPKALVPGLHPTLFHNNHRWEGSSALAHLFQGTGALATVVSGGISASLLRRGRGRPITTRLFLIWMTYNGFFLALPQLVAAAFFSGNDVGVALDYLRVSATGKTALALVALCLMPTIALALRRPVLRLARDPRQLDNGAVRAQFLFQTATLPALAAIALIVPFRIPRDMIEVMVVPAVVVVSGTAWLQAGAWSAIREQPGERRAVSIAGPSIALLLLLIVFQCVLRPGIRFY